MSYFLAVDLDDLTRHSVATLIDSFRADHPAKWIRPERLHVTVLFLGNVRDPDSLFALVEQLTAAHRSFALQLHGAGTFSTARAASVLWLGVAGDLAALKALRSDALRLLGGVAPPEERVREHRPHLTLARSKDPNGLEPVRAALERFESLPFRVLGLTLYESSGVAFRPVFTSPFAASS